jgi:hypothetical protein
MTKDLGIVGPLGFSVFLTCVRFLVLFLPTIVLSKTGGEKTKIVDPFLRLLAGSSGRQISPRGSTQDSIPIHIKLSDYHSVSSISSNSRSLLFHEPSKI